MSKVFGILLGILLTTGVWAGDDKKPKPFKSHDLIEIPMKFMKSKNNPLSLNGSQILKIEKEIEPKLKKAHKEKMIKITKVEKEVIKALMQGKTKSDVREKIDQITSMKREALDLKLDAFNEFQSILTPVQLKKLAELSAKK